ncbi:hypothetical protein TIFTF001_055719 [Ficus carica]|uniref:Uncharacterized protein n=1 Tax=Ficus carica TaxID=3494 RepID=A0AA88EF46_FICCA|nr:hypothetical protein TIFTF001_055719 [Ficus carica]
MIGECEQLDLASGLNQVMHGVAGVAAKSISLQALGIGECPKLSSLPEGMQPLTSLTHLAIWDCKTLEERCKREVGEDWPMIAHVPNLEIGSSSVDD